MEYIVNGSQFAFTNDQVFSQELKKPINRRIILLPGQVCHYWRMRKGDCCNSCAIPWANVAAHGKSLETYDFSEIPVAFETHKAMLDKGLENSKDVETIVIFNGGSFMTPHEIPEAFRQYTVERFAEHPSAIQLLVEARPEHLIEASLRSYLKTIGTEKKLKIAIGFESSDDNVRNVLHKKSIGKASFERKVNLAQDLGIQIQSYVFLKPYGLSEAEAIEDVLQTCEYLQNLGVDEMALSCAFVPEGGKLQPLYEAGEFRPPWLWSILKIMEYAQKNGWPLSVGGFDDFPPPIATAQNCGDCDSLLLEELDEFRKTGVFPFESVYCCCSNDKWLKEFSKEQYKTLLQV